MLAEEVLHSVVNCIGPAVSQCIKASVQVEAQEESLTADRGLIIALWGLSLKRFADWLRWNRRVMTTAAGLQTKGRSAPQSTLWVSEFHPNMKLYTG